MRIFKLSKVVTLLAVLLVHLNVKGQDADSTKSLRFSNDMYKQGQLDAKRHYKKYKAASTATLVTGIVATPVIGLLPATISSSTKIKDQNLNYPDSTLFLNKDYQEGYRMKAQQRKKIKTWINYAISWGASIIVIAAISAGVQGAN